MAKGLSSPDRRISIGLVGAILGFSSTTLALAAEPAGAIVSDATAISQPRNDLRGLPNFGQVAPGLYRGARPTPEGFKTLAQMGIKTVVDLEAFHSDRDVLRGSGMQYVQVPCTPIHVPQSQIWAFLRVATDPECQPVFVHCQHGADRTGVMIAAYRRTIDGWSADRAVAEMEKFGHHNVLVTFVPIVRTLDPEKTRQRFPLAVRPAVEIMR